MSNRNDSITSYADETKHLLSINYEKLNCFCCCLQFAIRLLLLPVRLSFALRVCRVHICVCIGNRTNRTKNSLYIVMLNSAVCFYENAVTVAVTIQIFIFFFSSKKQMIVWLCVSLFWICNEHIYCLFFIVEILKNSISFFTCFCHTFPCFFILKFLVSLAVLTFSSFWSNQIDFLFSFFFFQLFSLFLSESSKLKQNKNEIKKKLNK